MQLTKTLFTLFMASSALAVPIESDAADSIVAARDDFAILESRATIVDVTCKGGDTEQAYKANDIKSSYNTGKKNVDSQTGEKKAGAPATLKKFGANAGILDKLPAECKNLAAKDGHLFEYRLKGSELDRVIWKWSKTSKSQTYCMTITHRGKSENDFKACS